ncbi:MAG: RNA polymerase sigma factor WhiG, partial [Acidobacteria bacterium]|nr:RNA polymerase sigma factor WhiG [Acidobacteriota bacterium]
MSRAIPEPDTGPDEDFDDAADSAIAQAAEAEDSVAVAWDEYKGNASSEARDQLILHYSPLVK